MTYSEEKLISLILWLSFGDDCKGCWDFVSLSFGEMVKAYFYEGCWHFVRQKHKLVTVADRSLNTYRRVYSDAEKPKERKGKLCFAMLARGLCSHIVFLSSGSLLDSTRSDTRWRLQGWRRGQGSCSFLFAFYSYCCHPDLTLSLEASGDSRLQLRTSQGTPPSEVRVPDLRGPSPKPWQYWQLPFSDPSTESDF